MKRRITLLILFIIISAIIVACVKLNDKNIVEPINTTPMPQNDGGLNTGGSGTSGGGENGGGENGGGENGGGENGGGENGGNTTLNPPSSLTIAISKAYPLATADYFALLAELDGGESKFWFYGKTNGNAYPTADWATNGNGYTTVDWATHSTNTRAGSNQLDTRWDNVVGKIEYTVRDASNNIVMYCYDTKGGYHGSFRPNDRGNNHPGQSQRYLPAGTYTIEFKNISDATPEMPITLTFGTYNNPTEFVNEVIEKGQTVTKTLVLSDSTASAYKLNCNILP